MPRPEIGAEGAIYGPVRCSEEKRAEWEAVKKDYDDLCNSIKARREYKPPKKPGSAVFPPIIPEPGARGLSLPGAEGWEFHRVALTADFAQPGMLAPFISVGQLLLQHSSERIREIALRMEELRLKARNPRSDHGPSVDELSVVGEPGVEDKGKKRVTSFIRAPNGTFFLPDVGNPIQHFSPLAARTYSAHELAAFADGLIEVGRLIFGTDCSDGPAPVIVKFKKRGEKIELSPHDGAGQLYCGIPKSGFALERWPTIREINDESVAQGSTNGGRVASFGAVFAECQVEIFGHFADRVLPRVIANKGVAISSMEFESASGKQGIIDQYHISLARLLAYDASYSEGLNQALAPSNYLGGELQTFFEIWRDVEVLCYTHSAIRDGVSKISNQLLINRGPDRAGDVKEVASLAFWLAARTDERADASVRLEHKLAQISKGVAGDKTNHRSRRPSVDLRSGDDEETVSLLMRHRAFSCGFELRPYRRRMAALRTFAKSEDTQLYQMLEMIKPAGDKGRAAEDFIRVQLQKRFNAALRKVVGVLAKDKRAISLAEKMRRTLADADLPEGERAVLVAALEEVGGYTLSRIREELRRNELSHGAASTA